MTPLTDQVASAARVAANAWAAAMQQRQRPCNQSPEDEQIYFDPPNSVLVNSSPNNWVMILDSNPKRLAIIFSVSTIGANDVFLRPFAAGVPGVHDGIHLRDDVGPLLIDQQRFGNLTQVAWYITSTTSNDDVLAVELLLRTWPGR